VYVNVLNFVSIGLFSRQNPQFLPFFLLRHLVLSPIGNSLRKLNTGAQLQTFPYPTASKPFLYSDAFVAKSGAQFLTFKSVTNEQTDRQTDRQKTRPFWPFARVCQQQLIVVKKIFQSLKTSSRRRHVAALPWKMYNTFSSHSGRHTEWPINRCLASPCTTHCSACETYSVEDVSVVEANTVDSVLSLLIGRCHGAELVESAAAAAVAGLPQSTDDTVAVVSLCSFRFV